jgi:hypothetical protein
MAASSSGDIFHFQKLAAHAPVRVGRSYGWRRLFRVCSANSGCVFLTHRVAAAASWTAPNTNFQPGAKGFFASAVIHFTNGGD